MINPLQQALIVHAKAEREIQYHQEQVELNKRIKAQAEATINHLRPLYHGIERKMAA